MTQYEFTVKVDSDKNRDGAKSDVEHALKKALFLKNVEVE